MAITIEIDCRIKNDQYSKMFEEILQALDTLGVSGTLIKHIEVKGMDDGHGSWQLVLTITFMNPPSSLDKEELGVESYLDTRIPGCRLKEIIIEKTKFFIGTRITEAKNYNTILESYSVVDQLT